MLDHIINKPWFRYILVIFTLLEVASLWAYTLPWFNWLALAVVVLGTIYLLRRDFRLAVYLPIAEIIWGSLGKSFYWDFGSFQLSIRLVLFAVIVLYWFIGKSWKDIPKVNWANWPVRLAVLAYAVIAYGVLSGFLHHNQLSNIFFDANNYFYWLYFLVWYRVWPQIDWRRLLSIALAVTLVIAVKTLVIFHVFAHAYPLANIGYLYLWIRDTKVGELTFVQGNVWRIFFQSHIYLTILWLVLTVAFLRQQKMVLTRQLFVILTLLMTGIILSLSRSFWLALGLTFVLFILVTIKKLYQVEKKIARYSFLLGSFLASLALILLVLFIPPVDSAQLAAMLNQRFSGGESAVTSRANLLPVMITGIKENAVTGAGLGATLTYKNNDPRIRSQVNRDGNYTTYAFELGWLDFWYKFGMVGELVWLLIIIWMIVRGYILAQKKFDSSSLILGYTFGLIFLAGVHALTPYINHPLGIAYILIGLLSLEYYGNQTENNN